VNVPISCVRLMRRRRKALETSRGRQVGSMQRSVRKSPGGRKFPVCKSARERSIARPDHPPPPLGYGPSLLSQPMAIPCHSPSINRHISRHGEPDKCLRAMRQSASVGLYQQLPRCRDHHADYATARPSERVSNRHSDLSRIPRATIHQTSQLERHRRSQT